MEMSLKKQMCNLPLFLLLTILVLLHFPADSEAAIRKFSWTIDNKSISRLCHTKATPVVNGQFPGPATYVTEGDDVVIKVTNLGEHNLTIHWHGVRQILTAWADGPAYVTQCPIQTGQSYTHRFKVIGQRGTLFWHAHLSWLRATIHGAFIIRPALPFTFVHPSLPLRSQRSIIELPPIILGEWWIQDVEVIIKSAIETGGRYNASDALTINGLPGPLYNCSDTSVLEVSQGRTYLLRIINAAVNFPLYFAVTNHTLTVVEKDAAFVEPFDVNVALIDPGQTMNVLLKTDKPKGSYAMAVSVYNPQARIPFPKVPAVAIVHYKQSTLNLNVNTSSMPLPVFPSSSNLTFEFEYAARLKGVNFAFPRARNVFIPDDSLPLSIDEDLFYTVGYALQNCSDCIRSFSPGVRMGTAISNYGFVAPTISSILEAYYYNKTGVYEADFPDIPEVQYNYTGPPPKNSMAKMATKVKVLEYGANVQLVLQDTGTLFFESHPMHLHGQNFYVVGTGSGTYDPSTAPSTFNLDNPPFLNTVSVPFGGWTAIRFKATNPGVWFLHCHIDIHPSLGMAMAFIVKDGSKPYQKLPRPPKDLPKC
ncbi:hypothetical protein KP509_09G059000 [Ceratopteris richardii]|uniref:Laccase n=1 Tax=Ceratopteris richardii TaxID=49495 RepID=A0A8T2UAU0_CERRI|nr:hypothetical protein KP509_09G059000 [Ceratopteris richardii]